MYKLLLVCVLSISLVHQSGAYYFNTEDCFRQFADIARQNGATVSVAAADMVEVTVVVHQGCCDLLQKAAAMKRAAEEATACKSEIIAGVDFLVSSEQCSTAQSDCPQLSDTSHGSMSQLSTLALLLVLFIAAALSLQTC